MKIKNFKTWIAKQKLNKYIKCTKKIAKTTDTKYHTATNHFVALNAQDTVQKLSAKMLSNNLLDAYYAKDSTCHIKRAVPATQIFKNPEVNQ